MEVKGRWVEEEEESAEMPLVSKMDDESIETGHSGPMNIWNVQTIHPCHMSFTMYCTIQSSQGMQEENSFTRSAALLMKQNSWI